MKKIIYIFIISFLILPTFAYAKTDEVYKTQNNITINKKVYDKLCNIYSKQYIETLTANEYKKIISNNLDDIEIKEYSENLDLVPYGSSFSSNAKTIRIIKNGRYITLLVTWKGVPTVKSYDVIAIRFSDSSLDGSFTFKQTYILNNSYVTSYDSSNQIFSNGFGSSFKVGQGSNVELSLTFMVSGNGTVYGSYQHASSTTTLSESKDYTISHLGYGGVIKFSDSVKEKYDAMTGVSIDI